MEVDLRFRASQAITVARRPRKDEANGSTEADCFDLGLETLLVAAIE
jgi:hypothetical protein